MTDHGSSIADHHTERDGRTNYSRSAEPTPHVVIVGGGFGGLNAARALRKTPVRVTVIDRTNHHLFQPLLYQVATAGLSPADIAAPIRQVLRKQRNTEVMLAEVTGIDTANRRVITSEHDVNYDFLVLSTGSQDHYFGHDAWRQYASGLKRIADATAIRRTILLAFEKAEMEPREEERAALMTFVLVGGGPTGVEMAGAIAEMAHIGLVGEFRHIDTTKSCILLIEAGPRILAAFPEELALRAQRELEKHGVIVQTGAPVEEIDAGGVSAAGERIPSRTVIWTAGVRATPVAEWLGIQGDRSGRVAVDYDLAVPGNPDVFVIGDAMKLEQDGQLLPGVAPVAMQQGHYVASVIRSRIADKGPPGPFRYWDKGNVATVGRSFAILWKGNIRSSGFFTWLAWLAIHIWYLIGFRNRILVLIQWAWAYFTFQRSARLIVFDKERE